MLTDLFTIKLYYSDVRHDVNIGLTQAWILLKCLCSPKLALYDHIEYILGLNKNK